MPFSAHSLWSSHDKTKIKTIAMILLMWILSIISKILYLYTVFHQMIRQNQSGTCKRNSLVYFYTVLHGTNPESIRRYLKTYIKIIKTKFVSETLCIVNEWNSKKNILIRQLAFTHLYISTFLLLIARVTIAIKSIRSIDTTTTSANSRSQSAFIYLGHHRGFIFLAASQT